MNLNAIVCQRLAKKRDGKGRVPVNEIMVATPLVRKYIIEGEFEKLKGTVGNREAGSQSFDQHLTELFMKQIIDVSEAKRLATQRRRPEPRPPRHQQQRHEVEVSRSRIGHRAHRDTGAQRKESTPLCALCVSVCSVLSLFLDQTEEMPTQIRPSSSRTG